MMHAGLASLFPSFRLPPKSNLVPFEYCHAGSMWCRESSRGGVLGDLRPPPHIRSLLSCCYMCMSANSGLEAYKQAENRCTKPSFITLYQPPQTQAKVEDQGSVYISRHFLSR
jgi:hypothetical protein